MNKISKKEFKKIAEKNAKGLIADFDLGEMCGKAFAEGFVKGAMEYAESQGIIEDTVLPACIDCEYMREPVDGVLCSTCDPTYSNFKPKENKNGKT